MKKKLFLFLLSALCLVISACGKTSSAENEKDNLTTIENKRYSLEIEEEHALLCHAITAPDLIRCSEYLEGHLVPYPGIKTFMESLTEYKENEFSIELNNRYMDLELNEMSDFYNDFFEIFPMIMCQGWGADNTQMKGFDIDADCFGKAWTIGYSNEAVSGELPHNARAIFLESTGHPNKYYSHIYLLIFEDENKNLDCNIMYLNESDFIKITGIDSTKENGSCVNSSSSMGSGTSFTQLVSSIEKEFTGVAYNSISKEDVQKLIMNNKDFNELLKLFIDNQFFDYNPYSDTFNEEAKREADKVAKNAEPAIGMTKEEVINGLWGEPDKKNIDEYEWGIHEQWVYKNRGYIYFEDGIVTGIQHR